ncbi:MAG: tRNA 4-thiouridine(8) synthase ThiI [Clostridia bacterium]|nr:tRNA 4-thiouridine(8) synthase ThiI [Clostridia bacterium]
MKKVILIRFGEIFLKGKNRGFFEKTLVTNIRESLNSFGAIVEKIPGRYIVKDYNEDDEFEIVDRLKKIAGIFSFSVAYCVPTSLEEIEKISVELMKDLSGTFKVETNRADKHTLELNSIQISAKIGGNVLKNNKNLKVDVKNPKYILNIDIRENKETYLYEENILGVGGMPVSTSGNGLLLLSGGIDSPVAGYMMAKRGVKVASVHFHSYPYTSNFAREKVEKLAKIISGYTGKMTIYMVSMTELQEQIHEKCNDSYMITLLRRGMFTVAEKICKKYGKKMIITGESLGQVASQTIESMTVVSNVVKSTPIIRPLVAFDKCETIDIAKKIGTFETSIEPFEDCCTVFLPENPVTRPQLDKVLVEQNKIDFDDIIERAMQSIEIVEINQD